MAACQERCRRGNSNSIGDYTSLRPGQLSLIASVELTTQWPPSRPRNDSRFSGAVVCALVWAWTTHTHNKPEPHSAWAYCRSSIHLCIKIDHVAISQNTTAPVKPQPSTITDEWILSDHPLDTLCPGNFQARRPICNSSREEWYCRRAHELLACLRSVPDCPDQLPGGRLDYLVRSLPSRAPRLEIHDVGRNPAF
jgi:hypothetical protein